MAVIVESGFPGTNYPLTHPRICWRNYTGTITSSSETSGYEDDLADVPQTYNAWKPLSVPADWTMDFGSIKEVSFIAIGAHTLGSDGATINIQYDSGGGTFATLIGPHTPSSDDAILFLISGTNADRVRVQITSASANPELGVIRIGQATEWPQMARWTGIPIDEALKVQYRTNRSVTGEWLGRTVLGQGLEFEVNLEHLSETWRTGEWAEFRDYLQTGDATFFIASRPVSPYLDEVAYVWPADNPQMDRAMSNKNISGSVTLSLQGYSRL